MSCKDLHSTMYLFKLLLRLQLRQSVHIYIPPCIYLNAVGDAPPSGVNVFTFHHVSI